MNVLITGTTGYIGSAVAAAVADAGHAVHGLARTEAVGEEIARRGWIAARGDLRDAERLRSLARSFDAVIHAANTGGEDAAVVDTSATRAFLEALAGTGKPLVYTSGAWVVGAGATGEGSAVDPPALVAWRGSLEEEVVGAAPDVRALVLRPGIAYGSGGGIPGMVARGEIPVIGDGRQRWPLVHLDDLADLYVRALAAPAGSILHGVSHTLAMRDVALLGAVGSGMAQPAPITLEAARERFGAFAEALALDQEVSSRRTRSLTGWAPRAPSPAEELLLGSYTALEHSGHGCRDG